jgi:phage terminase small subunit
MELTEKQKRFCDEYLKDLNATQAAIRAGYSPKTAEQTASRLLRNVKVQEYISKRQKDRLKRTEIEQDSIVRELALIAFSDISDYVRVVEKPLIFEKEGHMVQVRNPDGTPAVYKTVEPTLTDNLTSEQTRALSIIKKGRDGFDIKPYDKVRALELLGKHLGMFQDKIELNSVGSNPFEGMTTEELKKLIDDG